jgi:hypothetical protein
MKIYTTTILLFLSLISGCSIAGERKENVNILSVPNKTNDLIVDIHLDEEFYKDFKLDKNNIAANEITIRNTKKQWYSFKPEDQESLRSSKGFYSNVWSPDNKYLVLPLGRFEGVAIFSVSYIKGNMQKLITKQYYGAELTPETTLKIVSEFGPALWHEFIGWEGKHTLVIRSGLSKDFKQFRYNIEKNELVGYKNWKGRVKHIQTIPAIPPQK